MHSLLSFFATGFTAPAYPGLTADESKAIEPIVRRLGIESLALSQAECFLILQRMYIRFSHDFRLLDYHNVQVLEKILSFLSSGTRQINKDKAKYSKRGLQWCSSCFENKQRNKEDILNL